MEDEARRITQPEDGGTLWPHFIILCTKINEELLKDCHLVHKGLLR